MSSRSDGAHIDNFIQLDTGFSSQEKQFRRLFFEILAQIFLGEIKDSGEQNSFFEKRAINQRNQSLEPKTAPNLSRNGRKESKN